MTLAEIAGAIGGRAIGGSDTPVTSVVLDSRQVTPGALFVALKGEHADGHDYVDDAVAAGAVGALVERSVAGPAVVVDDVVAALARLARVVVDKIDVEVVSVTGSCGKTTTKDLLAQVLDRDGPTIAPIGSYNNEIGFPLTVLRADESTRHLVLEASARGIGHIAYLCEIAPPKIGVVLNVGSAHLGVFGSRAAIAQAKGELVEALPADGVAVLNADDQLVNAMHSRTRARVVRFGTGEDADVRGTDIVMHAGRASYTLVHRGETARVDLQVYGEHNVANSLAVAAVALEVGMPLSDAAAALSDARPVSRWRMEVNETSAGVTVINDAYNANPESVVAGLRALVELAGERRTWAVLGEMAELGAEAPAAHERVGRAVNELGVARLVAVGGSDVTEPRRAGAAATGSRVSVQDAPDVEAAIDLLRRALEPGDVVLVKASRAAGLERIATALLDAQVPA